MAYNFKEASIEYGNKLFSLNELLKDNSNNLSPEYRKLVPAIGNVIDMIENMHNNSYGFAYENFTRFEKSFNQIDHTLKEFAGKNLPDQLHGAQKELFAMAKDLISEETSLPGRQILKGGQIIRDFHKSYGSEEMIYEAKEQLAATDGTGHRPSMEDLRTMSGHTTDIDSLVDHMIWMNSWITEQKVLKIADKNPDLYSQTFARLVNEISETSPDRMAEIMKKLNYHEVSTREMAQKQYDYIKSQNKEQLQQYSDLSLTTFYRDAEKAIHLVADNFYGNNPGEVIFFMTSGGPHKDAFKEKPSNEVAELIGGKLAAAFKTQQEEAAWRDLDSKSARDFLQGLGYSANDVRNDLFSSYTKLMADNRSASDSFKEMKNAMKILLSDDPYNSHQNAEEYLDKLDLAMEKVQKYLDEHKSTRFTDKGKERVTNAQNLLEAMKKLETDPRVKDMRSGQAENKRRQELPRKKAGEEIRKAMQQGLASLDKKELADPSGFLKMTYARMLYNQAKKNAGAPIDKEAEETEFRKFYQNKSVQSIVTKAVSEKDLKTIRAAAQDASGKILNDSLSKMKIQAVHAKKANEPAKQKEMSKNL